MFPAFNCSNSSFLSFSVFFNSLIWLTVSWRSFSVSAAMEERADFNRSNVTLSMLLFSNSSISHKVWLETISSSSHFFNALKVFCHLASLWPNCSQRAFKEESCSFNSSYPVDAILFKSSSLSFVRSVICCSTVFFASPRRSRSSLP